MSQFNVHIFNLISIFDDCREELLLWLQQSLHSNEVQSDAIEQRQKNLGGYFSLCFTNTGAADNVTLQGRRSPFMLLSSNDSEPISEQIQGKSKDETA